MSNLVSPDPDIVAACSTLWPIASELKIPFRFAETNSYLFGGSPRVSNSYASALWVIDHLFNIALGGGSGVNMQGGDVGDYIPIANSGSAIVEVHPEYYGLLLFSLVGTGILMPITLSTNDFKASLHAMLATPCKVRVVVVNKEVFQRLDITLDCGVTVVDAALIELRGASLSATSGQTIQGSTVGTDGSFTMENACAPASISGTKINFYVPAISAVLLEFQFS